MWRVTRAWSSLCHSFNCMTINQPNRNWGFWRITLSSHMQRKDAHRRKRMSLLGRTHEMGLCDIVWPPAKADLPCKDQASATQLPAVIHASVHTLARKVAGNSGTRVGDPGILYALQRNQSVAHEPTLWEAFELQYAVHPLVTGFGKVVIAIQGFQGLPYFLTPLRDIPDTWKREERARRGSVAREGVLFKCPRPSHRGAPFTGTHTVQASCQSGVPGTPGTLPPATLLSTASSVSMTAASVSPTRRPHNQHGPLE